MTMEKKEKIKELTERWIAASEKAEGIIYDTLTGSGGKIQDVDKLDMICALNAAAQVAADVVWILSGVLAPRDKLREGMTVAIDGFLKSWDEEIGDGVCKLH